MLIYYFAIIQGCQRVAEDWQRIIQVRSLVVTPQNDMRTWLKYSSLCRAQGRLVCSLKSTLNFLLELVEYIVNGLPTVINACVLYNKLLVFMFVLVVSIL